MTNELRSLLESRWSDFPQMSAEGDALNRRLSLGPDQAFDSGLPPVFFVGDPARADYLFVGLKPGRNRDTTPGFAAEMSAIRGTFEQYWDSRLNYFSSPALNARHYWPAAKLVALLEGDVVAPSLGAYLRRHVVQTELFPLFAYSTGFTLKDLAWMRRETESGRLATEVFDMLVETAGVKAVVARYSMTWEAVCSALNASLEAPGRATAMVNGRSLPLYGILGRNVADSDLAALAGIGVRPRPRPELTRSHGPLAVDDPGSERSNLMNFAIGLGDDVTQLPIRANGSVVFRRRRNFFTVHPGRRTGLRVDILESGGFRDGLRLGLDVSRSELFDAVRRAYNLAR